MNVREINPGTLGKLSYYFPIAISLTIVSIWSIIALQCNAREDPRRESLNHMADLDLPREKIDEPSVMRRTLERIGWPVMLVRELIEKRKAARKLNTNT